LLKRAAGYGFLSARRCLGAAVTVITFFTTTTLLLVLPVQLRGATIFINYYFYCKTCLVTLLVGGHGPPYVGATAFNFTFNYKLV
jgi:hypothetical protein